MRTPKPWLTLVLAALWLLAGPGCPTAEDDDAGDDDDSGADDDTGDDDDTGGDDDTGDDDDSGAPPCADQGGITLTLDTSQTINSCGAPWSELDVAMVLRDSTVCSGCAGEAASGEVWVYPAELFLDFSDLDCEVTRAIVQVIDYVGGGAAQVRLYDASGALIDSNTNAQVAVEESIPVGYLGGPPAAGAGVDGCETMVTLIQLL